MVASAPSRAVSVLGQRPGLVPDSEVFVWKARGTSSGRQLNRLNRIKFHVKCHQGAHPHPVVIGANSSQAARWLPAGRTVLRDHGTQLRKFDGSKDPPSGSLQMLAPEPGPSGVRALRIWNLYTTRHELSVLTNILRHNCFIFDNLLLGCCNSHLSLEQPRTHHTRVTT